MSRKRRNQEVEDILQKKKKLLNEANNQVAPTPAVLPDSFTLLAQIFQAVDSAVFFHSARDENPTFAKIQREVEFISGKNFTLDHLAQIKFIYPEAYTHAKLNSTITIEFKKNDDNQIAPLPKVNLTKRSEEFRKLLWDRFRAGHTDLPLGQLPNFQGKEAMSVNELFEKTHAKIITKQNQIPDSFPPSSSEPVRSIKVPVYRGKENIPEKFAEKFALKKKEKMMELSPEVLKKEAILSNLPKLTREIHFQFPGAKAVRVEKLIENVAHAFSANEVKEYLKVLCDVIPSWASLTNVDGELYLKLNKIALVEVNKSILGAKTIRASLQNVH